jgi:hypothetical protein
MLWTFNVLALISFTGSVSSFVAEAVGLAFTTGLHRSTKEFNMDPVTLQVSPSSSRKD